VDQAGVREVPWVDPQVAQVINGRGAFVAKGIVSGSG
jgi:hypothetical protein